MRRRIRTPLNGQRTLFVAAYLKTLSVTQAALDAGYSPAVAPAQGQRLMRTRAVAEAIRLGIEDRNARVLITADRVVREIARVALADPRRLFDADGNIRDPTSLTADEAACISSYEVVQRADGSVSRKVRLHSKVAALELLAKHVGVVRDDPAQVNVGIAIQVVSGVPRVPTDAPG